MRSVPFGSSVISTKTARTIPGRHHIRCYARLDSLSHVTGQTIIENMGKGTCHEFFSGSRISRWRNDGQTVS